MQRNLTTAQKMTTFDNGENQQLVHNYNCLYNILRIKTLTNLVEGSQRLKRGIGKLREVEPNTMDMVKRLHKPSMPDSSTSDQDIKASMPKEILKAKKEKNQPDEKQAKNVEEKQRRGSLDQDPTTPPESSAGSKTL